MDNVRAYDIATQLNRSETTLYELEHPEYETQDEFIKIMAIWEGRYKAWYKQWGEMLPKPKRKMGRPPSDAQKGPQAKKYAMTVRLGLSDDLLTRIALVKGDLPFEDCIRQLLAHALEKPVTE